MQKSLDVLKQYKDNKSILFYINDILKLSLEKIIKNSIIFGNLPYNIYLKF